MELLEGNYTDNFNGDSYHGNSIFITGFRNWASGVRAAHPPLSSFKNPNGGCTQYYGDYAGMSRAPISLGGFSYYFNLIGNVIGMNGQRLLNESALPNGCIGPQNSFIVQVTANDEYNSARNTNSVPMWTMGSYQVGNTLKFDTTMLPTITRTANWDWVSSAEHCYGTGGTTDLGCSGAAASLPNSFYLTSKPAFFGTHQWPWVDPTSGTTYTLPAMYCFQHNKMPTCLGATTMSPGGS
jgi:hypothetical protein